MIFMFQHLLRVLMLKDLPPVTRLAAIYLASNGTFIQDGPDVPPDEPTRKVSIAAVSAWIGCDPAEVVEIIHRDLVDIGFTAVQIDGDEIHYSLPELPEEPPAPARRPQPEAKLSIYVISSANGLVKVGISGLVSKRLADLQAANPAVRLSVEFEASGPPTPIRRAEKQAHAALADHSIGNEWFKVEPARAIEVAREILGWSDLL